MMLYLRHHPTDLPCDGVQMLQHRYFDGISYYVPKRVVMSLILFLRFPSWYK